MRLEARPCVNLILGTLKTELSTKEMNILHHNKAFQKQNYQAETKRKNSP